MSSLAPIVLFVYNRPWHTRQVLNSLKANHLASQSILYVFSDGEKQEATSEDRANILAIKQLLLEDKWCKAVTIIHREKNYGLAANVIEGITYVINRHDKVIVLEDDLLVSPHFLSYCNEGLGLYKDIKNVYAINGYQFPLNTSVESTFLSTLATSSWGWATWKDRWEHFEEEPSGLGILQSNLHLKRRFNFADYNYVDMLNNKKSWAIKWYYTVFMRNGLGVFPTKSLVQNIGFDNSGEHCEEVEYDQNLFGGKIKVILEHKINLDFEAKMLHFFSEPVKKINETKSKGLMGVVERILKKAGLKK